MDFEFILSLFVYCNTLDKRIIMRYSTFVESTGSTGSD